MVPLVVKMCTCDINNFEINFNIRAFSIIYSLYAFSTIYVPNFQKEIQIQYKQSFFWNRSKLEQPQLLWRFCIIPIWWKLWNFISAFYLDKSGFSYSSTLHSRANAHSHSSPSNWKYICWVIQSADLLRKTLFAPKALLQKSDIVNSIRISWKQNFIEIYILQNTWVQR